MIYIYEGEGEADMIEKISIGEQKICGCIWGKIFERAIDWLLSNSFELQFAKSGESTPEAICRLQ